MYRTTGQNLIALSRSTYETKDKKKTYQTADFTCKLISDTGGEPMLSATAALKSSSVHVELIVI